MSHRQVQLRVFSHENRMLIGLLVTTYSFKKCSR